MRPTTHIATALLALCLFGAATGLALADVQGGDRFRVVGLSGAETLKLTNGPASWSGVEVEVPFDARNLRATGIREGNFLQLSYRVDTGYDITGWADVRFLAADQDHQPTVYRVVAARGSSVPLLDAGSYGVRAYIPSWTSLLPACGPCRNGYCQVRFQTRRGPIEGFVAQGYLAISRPAYSGLAVVQAPEPNAAYADSLPPDGYAVSPQPDADYTDVVPLPSSSNDDRWHWWWHREHRYGN